MSIRINWRQPSNGQISLIKGAGFVLCLLPLAFMLWALFNGNAVNPIEDLTRDSGSWTLRFLLITLAISPLRALGAPGWILRLRRMLGLYAFFYVSIHLSTYLWLDKFFDWPAIGHDIIKRPFITVGMLAFTLLIPLAITSTDNWMRRLKRNWGKLHKLSYIIAPLGVLHYLWLIKLDIQRPLIYAAICTALLLWRAWPHLRPTLAARVK